MKSLVSFDCAGALLICLYNIENVPIFRLLSTVIFIVPQGRTHNDSIVGCIGVLKRDNDHVTLIDPETFRCAEVGLDVLNFFNTDTPIILQAADSRSRPVAFTM